MNFSANKQPELQTKTSDRKIVLIFSANYLPNLGGVEKFTYHLSLELERIGHHAIIVTNNVFNLAEYEIHESGFEIFRLPCHSLLKGRLPIPHKNKSFNQLIEAIKHRNIDYVLINTRFYPHSLLGAKIARQKNIKPVIIDHGSAYLTLGNPFLDFAIKIYEHLITILLNRYQGDYYGISQASLNWLKTFRIKGQGVINNSIDADVYLSHASNRNYKIELNLNKKDYIVCFTGRLIPEKGIIPLLNCAEYLINLRPDIHFVFAGDGPLKKLLLNKDLSNVHLLGKTTSEDIAALLVQSDIFCLPTRSEGFSTSLLEASACYTPSIITDVGGVAELIPTSDYGIILKDTSVKSLSDAITHLASNKEETYRLGQNIGKYVRRHFSWRITAEKVLNACYDANCTFFSNAPEAAQTFNHKN